MTPPLVSVIVAAMNTAALLPECLDSILSQDWPRLEVVVADDASTDETLSVALGYAALFPEVVRVVPLPRRQGPGGARNEAARACRGEYLTTLDSDDCLADAGKISREMSLLLAARGRVIAFSDVEMISPAGVRTRLSQTQCVVEGGILEAVLTRTAMIPRDFTLSRRAYEEAGGYDPTLSTHEDWDLKIRLAARHRFKYTGAPGVVYRRRASGLSALPLPVRIGNLRAVFDRHVHLLPLRRRRAATAVFLEHLEAVAAAAAREGPP